MQSLDGSLEQTFIPRSSVPFETVKLPPLPSQSPTPPQPTPKAAPPPRLAYPILQQTQRPSTSVREVAQQNIQKELSELHQRSLSLDELIQKAINVKVQHDYQPGQAKTPPIPQTKPIIQPELPESKEFWWPEAQQIKKAPVVKAALKPSPQVTLPKAPVIEPAPAVVRQPRVMNTVQPQVKPKVSSGPEWIDYLLFTISTEEDPYHNSNRRLVIYSIKATGYLILLAAIWEIRRYLPLGISLNGILEIASIIFVAGIFFYFGENFNILFKPSNPYQVQEIV